VNQLGHLVLQGGHKLGVVVPHGVHRDAAQAVQVSLAIHIPHAHALAVRQGDGHPPVGVHDVRRSGLDQSHLDPRLERDCEKKYGPREWSR